MRAAYDVLAARPERSAAVRHRRRRRRPGRRRQQDVRARAGAVDRREPAGPDDPDPARGRADRRRHVRLLRELRQADPQGAAQGVPDARRSTSPASSARSAADPPLHRSARRVGRIDAAARSPAPVRDNGRSDLVTRPTTRHTVADVGAPATAHRAVRRGRGRPRSLLDVALEGARRRRTCTSDAAGPAARRRDLPRRGPQLRRGVLARHRRSPSCSPLIAHRGRRGHPAHRQPDALDRAGRSRWGWSSAARWATWSIGSSARRAWAAATSSTGSACSARTASTGRSSTSPTRRSSAARSSPACLSLLRHRHRRPAPDAERGGPMS